MIKTDYEGRMDDIDNPEEQKKFARKLVAQGEYTQEQAETIVKQALREYGYLERYEEEENRNNQKELLEQYGTMDEVVKHRDEIIQNRIEQARNNIEDAMSYQLAIDYISGMTDRSFNDLAIRTGYMTYDDLNAKRGTIRSASVMDLIAKNKNENGEER